MRGAFLFQAIRQLLPHLNDAVSHTMDLLQPALIDKKNHKRSINMHLEHMCNTSAYLKNLTFCTFCSESMRARRLNAIPEWAQIRWVKNCWCNSCTVHWGVGVDGPDENLELRLDPLCLLCILTHHSEASNTLTCERQHSVKYWSTQKYTTWCLWTWQTC